MPGRAGHRPAIAVGPMNERGIFFILIVLYLIVSIIGLHNVANQEILERNRIPEAL